MIPLCRALPLEWVAQSFDFPARQSGKSGRWGPLGRKTRERAENLRLAAGKELMSQTIEKRDAAPQELRTLYAVVREELVQVDELLRTELTSEYPFVEELARHGFRLGGKRLRPALVLLAGKLCGGIDGRHLQLAAAVEMVHTASLIHDDVDEATIRRHLDTVNARRDNEASILLGDYLRAGVSPGGVARQSVCGPPFDRSQLADVRRRLRQIQTRGNYDLTEDGYLEIIADKTASLCACCCEIGAHYAAGEAERQALTAFGRKLGVAFQIVDDLLDVLGDEQTIGKSLGTDLVKQKPTLPLIRLLNQSGPEQRAKMVEILSTTTAHHREALKPWLEKSDAISYSKRRATEFVESAATELRGIPDAPSKDSLVGIAQFVVDRRH